MRELIRLMFWLYTAIVGLLWFGGMVPNIIQGMPHEVSAAVLWAVLALPMYVAQH